MSVSAMGIFRFFVCLFLLLLGSASFADDNDQASSEIITMTGAAYGGDVWILDINYPISKTITYVAGSIANGKNILNAANGFAAQINADPDALQILTALAVDSDEGYSAEVHLQMIEGVDGFDASVSVIGNNDRELSVSITNNLNLDETDSDLDGLTDIEESNLGTSLTNDDTDRDTLPDGWEVENGRDPLVADYQVDLGLKQNGCVLDDSGVRCWGWNSHGQLFVPALVDPSWISVGAYHSCFMDINGIHCSGSLPAYDNVKGIPDLVNPRQIDVGLAHACALDDTGVVCWGANWYGESLVPELVNPSYITTGRGHSCAIDELGYRCWGLITDSDRSGNVPLKISSGYQQFCAIYSDGLGYCSIGSQNLINPTDISTGSAHACALDDTGVVCWGSGEATLVPELVNPTFVEAGVNSSCAVDDTGLVCWGNGDINNPPTLLMDPDDDGFVNQNGKDAFPLDSTEWLDSDFDGIGNNSDLDDDGDGLSDEMEVMQGINPLVPNPDIDNDGIANELDADNDNDGALDHLDAFPLNSLEQLDSDLDGIGNKSDADNDNDGVMDVIDLFPLDALESSDSDSDGVGDNADFFPNSAEYSLDSDFDQMPDAWERKYGLNPTDASDALLDQDNDGLTALEEYEAGTIPLKILDIDANGSVDALTDGLIILRYLFNLRGDSLVNGALGDNAMRTNSADVAAYIQSLMPGS